jgi:hypothetical protein
MAGVCTGRKYRGVQKHGSGEAPAHASFYNVHSGQGTRPRAL